MQKPITFCCTGHRPQRLGGFSSRLNKKLLEIAMHHISEFTEPEEKIISGMALGWDTAIATAAIALGRHLTAAVPFEDQPLVWEQRDRNCYEAILREANEVEVICKGPYKPKYLQIRNKWMIDRSDVVFSLYDGESHGGTYNTLRYADEKGIKEIEAWSYFQAWELL